MFITELKNLGIDLYLTYRLKHETGYPITKSFIANLTTIELETLRNGFIIERKKYESESIFEHNESFWAMYDELL